MTTKTKVDFRMDPELLAAVDHLIELKLFKNRSAFMTIAAIELLNHYPEFESSLKEGTPHE